MIKKINKAFNDLEHGIRVRLSRYPILYAFLAGTGLVLFWRGVWHIADDLSLGSISSMVIGMFILILTGIFVSEFIGNKLIISGLVGEKRLVKKEEEEIETEETQIKNLQNTLARLEKKLDHIDGEHFEKK